VTASQMCKLLDKCQMLIGKRPLFCFTKCFFKNTTVQYEHVSRHLTICNASDFASKSASFHKQLSSVKDLSADLGNSSRSIGGHQGLLLHIPQQQTLGLASPFPSIHWMRALTGGGAIKAKSQHQFEQEYSCVQKDG
jgi:hypothetical protein